MELGWVKDGIEGIEYEAVENLLYIAVLSRTVASSIVSIELGFRMALTA